jgi:putative NADH-flavin reductase
MKIDVFGATGATGLEVVNQALAWDMQVNALVRRPLPVIHQNLTVLSGDLADQNAVNKIVKNSNSVLSALGFVPKLFGQKSTDLYSQSAATLIEAMKAARVHKLIYITSAGVENDPNEFWPYKHILKPLLLQTAIAAGL